MATTSHLERIVERLQNALAGIDGTSDYNFNLSTSDAVQWNPVQLPPPRDPCIYLTDLSIVQSQNENRNLSSYFNVVTVGFVGIVSGNADDTENRMTRVSRLLADINWVLQGDRQLTALAATPLRAVEDIVIRNMGMGYTDAFGVGGYGYCTGEIEMRYAVLSGTGI